MYVVFNTLAPIGLLVLLGFLLRRFTFAPADFFGGINRLVYWVALPALLLEKTSQPWDSGAEAMRIFGLLAAVTFACVLIGYLAARLGRLPMSATGVFVQGAFRGNLAYIGLPVLLFSLSGEPAAASKTVETAAVLALAPLIPIYNIFAVLVLIADQANAAPERPRRLAIGHAARNVLTNPLLLACAAGMLLSAGGVTLPHFAQRGLSATGQMALPLSLITIGASLKAGAFNGMLKRVTGAVAIKVFVAPLLGFLLAGHFGLEGLSLRAALIFLACPTAVASYVMAEQLGGDADLAGHIVILSTVMALPGLALVLLLA